MATSKAGHEAFNWFLRIEDKDVTDEALRRASGRWRPLDDKVRAAVLNISKGEVGRELDRALEDERVKHRRQLSGAMMLRIIFRYFQTKLSLTQVFDITDLLKIQYPGDQHITTFYDKWLKTLNGLEDPNSVNEQIKCSLFLKHCEQSELMKSDVDHFKRLPKGHAEKCYDWLLGRMKFRIDELRERRNERALDHNLIQDKGKGKSQVPGPAMPGATGTPKGGLVCPYFAAGNCLKGDSCDMVHPPPPAAPGVPRPGKAEGKRSRSGKPNGKGNQGSEPKIVVSTQGGDPNNATACFQNSDGHCPRGDA